MSAKTSNQPGRRTPLSLSGGITKGQTNNTKGGGNSANGHTNNNKQDNKNQQNQQQKTDQQQATTNAQKQTDAKENPATKVQNKAQNETKIPKPQTNQNSDNSKAQKQNDNKKTSEKQQNGVAAAAANNNKANSGQQANKDKQPNGNDAKLNEKDKKGTSAQEKVEKVEVDGEVEKNKPQEKPEKEDKKSKDDKKEQDLKKDGGKKTKEDIKENDDKKVKEDIKENVDNKKDQKPEVDNKNTNIVATHVETQETSAESSKEQQKDVVEDMEGVEEEPQQKPDSVPTTPKTANESKTTTPSKTPTKAMEKTPIKLVEKTPTKATEKTTPKAKPTNREVTTAIDDVEMEPLTVDQSPTKGQAADGLLAPSATSTPGKIVLPKRNVPAAKTDVQLAMQSSSTPERPRVFSQISGRRGIRPITDYTPSKFQSNPQFRESYRRINTELDATNTSLNVTVGSEVPNNSSFSFFGRGRKRDRTPPQHSQSAIGELQTDMEISPPKRARMDFFSAVSSPLTLLRNRFSKANLQSSTPVKLEQKLNDENEDDIEVQNVSGVSVHEDIAQAEDERENSSEEGDTTLGVEATAENIPIEGELEIADNGDKELPLKSERQTCEDGDIKITVTDTAAKNKRCIVM